MPQNLLHILCSLYVRERTRLVAQTRRSFPKARLEDAEDAVASALCSLIASPSAVERAYATDGLPAVGGLLRVAAWRQMRAHYRKSSTRRETCLPADHRANRAPDWHDPERALVFDDSLQQLIDMATRRFAHGQRAAFRRAMHLRLVEGHTDTEAAAATGVPREYVNRAKCWLRQFAEPAAV